MNVIISKNNFTLCEVPTPQGYPQSQTHSGIATWDGVCYLTSSPYPSYKRNYFVARFKSIIRKISGGKLFCVIREEAYENPCLYYGDLKSGYPPVRFALMQNSPLMDTPDDYYGLPAFNSDPDIYIEDGVIYVLNRVVYRTKLCPGESLNKYEIRIFLISGEIDKNRFKLERIQRLLSSDDRLIISPCLTKYNNNFYLFELETNACNDGESFQGLYYLESQTILGLKDYEKWKYVKVNTDDYLPWHMSVFLYQGRLYSIIAGIKKGQNLRCWQLFGEFNDDLTELRIYKTPLTDYNSYRGAAYVDDNGMFVLYSTTVGEHISGSRAVDGRDIIMAKMPFAKLLEEIRRSEK